MEIVWYAYSLLDYYYLLLMITFKLRDFGFDRFRDLITINLIELGWPIKFASVDMDLEYACCEFGIMLMLITIFR